MVLVLLTLIPAQAAGETGTGTDEGEKTYTVTLNGNGGSLKGEDLVTVTYSEENPTRLVGLSVYAERLSPCRLID